MTSAPWRASATEASPMRSISSGASPRASERRSRRSASVKGRCACPQHLHPVSGPNFTMTASSPSRLCRHEADRGADVVGQGRILAFGGRREGASEPYAPLSISGRDGASGLSFLERLLVGAADFRFARSALRGRRRPPPPLGFGRREAPFALGSPTAAPRLRSSRRRRNRPP